MLCVRDIMTRELVKLSPEATIREAMETLATNHLSGAPVVAGDRVLGVISMTDILGFIISAPVSGRSEQGESLGDGWEDDDALDEDDEIQAAALSDDVWDEWTTGGETRVDDALPEAGNLLDQHTVEEAMNQEVFSVPPSASVKAAATMMRERSIHRVLVMDRKSLVGIVSALDIARTVSDKGIAGKTGIRAVPHCDNPSDWITS
jgi:CBS domain-containing protein